MKHLLLAPALLFALSLSVSAGTRNEQLTATLAAFQEQYGFPGATAAIALPDGLVIAAAVGMADVEAKTPMKPETRMLAASIGKSFVAATALSLEAEGKLALADRVADYLGNRAWFARVPNHRTMTIRDLMRHSAGLPDHVYDARFQSNMTDLVAKGADAPPPEDAVSYVLDKKPLFPPGSAWTYSDTGYLLLGLVIEEAAGRTYYDLVTERFLAPLGLVDTAPSNSRRITGLAVGYTSDSNPFGLPPRTMDETGRLLWDPAMEWTGGGLVSTSPDLAAWGHSLFGGTASAMPGLDRLLDGLAISPDAPGILYGAGVAIYAQTPRGTVYGHGGWIPGYVSSLRHYADPGVTVVFQINTDVGIFDDSTDLVPELEAALADLAIGWVEATESGGE